MTAVSKIYCATAKYRRVLTEPAESALFALICPRSDEQDEVVTFDLIESGKSVQHRRPLRRLSLSVDVNAIEQRRSGHRKPKVTIALIWPMRVQLLSCTACRCGTTEIAPKDIQTRAAKTQPHVSTLTILI